MAKPSQFYESYIDFLGPHLHGGCGPVWMPCLPSIAVIFVFGMLFAKDMASEDWISVDEAFRLSSWRKR